MILYRYQQLNHNTKDSILNHYLYFSKPSSLNDPFDCHFSPVIEGTHYEKVMSVKRMVGLLNLSREERRKAEKDCLQEMINKELDYDFIYKSIDEINDKISICCLSDTCEDLLMWAHYADGHMGVCLKYDIEQDTLPDCILKPVNYKPDLTKSNLVQPSDDDDIISIFTTKSKHWEYEREYRLINHLGHEKVKYRRGCLKGIIFGCKVDTDKKNDLINAINAEGWFFNLYEAVQSRDSYQITIAKL